MQKQEVSRTSESNKKQVGEFMKEARQQNDPRKQDGSSFAP